MPSVIKQGGRYYGQFFSSNRRPQRKRVALGTKRRRDAEQALARMVAAHLRGDYDPWTQEWDSVAGRGRRPGLQEPVPLLTSSTPLGTAADVYLEGTRHLRPDTQRRYRQIVESFVRSAGRRRYVGEVSPGLILRWLDSTSAGDLTRERYNHHLGYFLRFCVKHGALDHDPTKEVRLRRVPEAEPKAMSEGMTARFVEVARNWKERAPRAGLRPYD